MRSFGELEAEVMRLVWHHHEPVTVRTITETLSRQRPLAYTTVMTVTDRLRDKGWLTRVKNGRSYRYAAALSPEDYTAQLMGQVLDDSTDRAAALMRFAGQLKSEEAVALRAALRRRPPDDTQAG